MVLIGAYQTSWFRFHHLVDLMIDKNQLSSPFKTYIGLAMETFQSTKGGPRPRFQPSGINLSAVYLDGNRSKTVLRSVVSCLVELLKWIDNCDINMFSPTSLQNRVIEVSKELTRIDAKTELDKFQIMLIVHVCALSHTILKPSPKLLNLFYPIPKMGSYNNLLSCGVVEDEHDATLT